MWQPKAGTLAVHSSAPETSSRDMGRLVRKEPELVGEVEKF